MINILLICASLTGIDGCEQDMNKKDVNKQEVSMELHQEILKPLLPDNEDSNPQK